MSNEEILRDLLRRWRTGDQDAATEIYRRYESRVQELAERKLGRYLWHRVDPDDIMLMALKSVLRLTSENSCELDRNGSLWGLVASIARNKVLQQAAYHSAPRRDVRREQGLQSQLPEGDEQPELVAPVPGPDEAMSWFDALSLIRQRLKPDSFAIIAMKLEGYSIPEIARELGFARQTVSIRLRHIEGRLREILGRQSDESPDFGVADDEIFRE